MSKTTSTSSRVAQDNCPYLEVRNESGETRYICTVQGIRMSEMDVSVLCKHRSAWTKCYAYLFAKDLTKGKLKIEVLSDAEFEPIKQQLMSNIEIEIWEVAKQLNVTPQVVRHTIEEYNKKHFVGVVTSNKIIPARKFIETIRSNMRAKKSQSVRDFATKFDLDPQKFTQLLLMLIEKNYI